MNKKQQIIFIHGGDSFNTRKEFLDDLRAYQVDPYVGKAARWYCSLTEIFGGDFDVISPDMPSGNCDFEAWTIWFGNHVPFIKNNTILIGHSLGANFLVAYLAEHTLPIKIKSLHLVAGCAGEGSFPFPQNGENIEKQLKNIVLYHSHDDPVVPFSDTEKYKTILPSARLLEFEDRGHFLQGEFPELVREVAK